MNPDALNLLEGVAGSKPRRRMKITDANTSKGELIYTVHCVCDSHFKASYKVDKIKRIRCPNCKREAYLFSLLRDWRE